MLSVSNIPDFQGWDVPDAFMVRFIHQYSHGQNKIDAFRCDRGLHDTFKGQVHMHSSQGQIYTTLSGLRCTWHIQGMDIHDTYKVRCTQHFQGWHILVVAFSSLARILGNVRSFVPRLCFFFFFFVLFCLFVEVEFSSRELIPLFMPESVHSGSASWNDCGRVFPDELRVSSFPDGFPYYA